MCVIVCVELVWEMFFKQKSVNITSCISTNVIANEQSFKLKLLRLLSIQVKPIILVELA